MNILVISPSWIGDMMMSHSLYRTLKAEHPNAVIDVMAPAWCRPLLSRMPEVNEALAMPFEHGALALIKRCQLGKELNVKGYDRAYILPNSFKSALVPFFAGIPHRIGWRGEMRRGLLNDVRVLYKKAFPLMVHRYIALSYEKGRIQSARDLPQPLLWPRLVVKEEEKQSAIASFKLNPERTLIGFCPGAEFGPAKRWPHYHYAVLAQRLINQSCQVALFGSEKEREIGEQIITGLIPDAHIHCLNLVGKTQLEEAIILLAACQAVISNDSGLMHIAAALDCPLIALYGPSSPDFTPPLSHRVRVIRLITGYHKVRKSNADNGYHQSLIDITPERVLSELEIFFPRSIV